MRPARLSGRRPGGMAGLRMRLTAVCALLTTAVLAAALWAGWAMARQQLLASADALLAGSLDRLLEKLEAGGPVSDRFLAELELRSRAVVYLLDNGQPLQFAGAWQPATPREALAAQALEAAGGEGICRNVVPGRRCQTPVALTGPAGDAYTGYAARPAAPEGVLILLLQDTAARQAALAGLAARYGALGLAGALVLGLTAWLLAGRLEAQAAPPPRIGRPPGVRGLPPGMQKLPGVRGPPPGMQRLPGARRLPKARLPLPPRIPPAFCRRPGRRPAGWPGWWMICCCWRAATLPPGSCAPPGFRWTRCAARPTSNFCRWPRRPDAG